MKPFAAICECQPEEFKRVTGLSITDFNALVDVEIDLGVELPPNVECGMASSSS